MRRWIFLALLLAVSTGSRAAFLRDVPLDVVQPDGRVLHAWTTGDENWSWLHDQAGYLITRDAAGRYVYALRQGGECVPSTFEAGNADPVRIGAIRGPSPPDPGLAERARLRAEGRPTLAPGQANIGLYRNLVIFIRFSDQTEFTDTPSQYDAWFNGEGAAVNSVRHYYEEASYGQLHILSSLIGTAGGQIVSYQDSHPRSYYQPESPTNPGGYTDLPDSTGWGFREHAMLAGAVRGIEAEVPDTLKLDENGDGLVDNLCFMLRGTLDNGNLIIWPHTSALSGSVQIHGIPVNTYNINLDDLMKESQRGVGTVCHEMFHSLGAPDLYHYNNNGDAVGPWDLMSEQFNPPQHMGAWMKYKYGGWIPEIPVVSVSGRRALAPLAGSGSAWKIWSPNSPTQFFVVEYRSRGSSIFDRSVPGSGMLVYRIDEATGVGHGNGFGPPDEVYIYRPNGFPAPDSTGDGEITRAVFSADSLRTAINDTTNPRDYLVDGSLGGLSISGIGSLGDSIRFTVTTSGVPGCPTTLGDANGDGKVDVSDLLAVVGQILGTDSLSAHGKACADVVTDQTINVLDLIGIVNVILNPGGQAPLAQSLLAPRLPAGPGHPVGHLGRSNPGSDGANSVPWTWAETDSSLELSVEASSVAGLELTLPWPAGCSLPGHPSLGGAAAGARLDWQTGGGACVLLAWSLSGQSLGPGWLSLQVPWRGCGEVGPPAQNPAAGSLQPAVILCGTNGEPLRLGAETPPESGPGANPGARILGIAPNPTAGGARLTFELGRGAHVSLGIYDAAGRRVALLLDQWRPAGEFTAAWDGSDSHGRAVSAGIYFARLQAGEIRASSRILLVRSSR